MTRGASLALEASADTSHQGRAPKKNGPHAGTVPFIRHGPTTTSAARRARAVSSSAAAPLQRLRAPARLLRGMTRGAGLALEAAAVTTHHMRVPKERGVSPTQYRSAARELTTTSVARMLRLIPSDRSAGAPMPRDTHRWLGVGCRSVRVAPRARVDGKRPLLGTVPI